MSSATGGYLTPSSSTPIPGGLTLNQFIQTVLVGISGLSGSLVRPSWQPAPPKQPDLSVNWMAFSVKQHVPDANGYNDIDDIGNYTSQRHEDLTISCSFYGPDCLDYCMIVRDGFQIQQNLEVLKSANMGFVETTTGLHMPDLTNGRWIDRIIMEVILRREIQRVYPVLSLLSAEGTINTILETGEYTSDWLVAP